MANVLASDFGSLCNLISVSDGDDRAFLVLLAVFGLDSW